MRSQSPLLFLVLHRRRHRHQRCISPSAPGLSGPPERSVLEKKAGPSACRDGVDVHLRRLDCHACSGCFVRKLVSSVKPRYVGRCTTYIQSIKKSALVGKEMPKPNSPNNRPLIPTGQCVPNHTTSKSSFRLGMRYASAVEEAPRGTILIIGSRAADWETCMKPTERARAPVSCSVWESVQVDGDDGAKEGEELLARRGRSDSVRGTGPDWPRPRDLPKDLRQPRPRSLDPHMMLPFIT